MSTFDPSIVHQSEYWVDGAGRTVRLADLDPHYLANLSRFLDRHAEGIHAAYLRTACTPIPFSDDVAHEVNVEIAHYDVSDEDFLRATPLYREIERLIAAGGAA